MTKWALSGATIFDGQIYRRDYALVIEDDAIVLICPSDEVPPDGPVTELDGGLLTAGFVDIQVNGGGGVLLNEQPTVEGIRAICAAHAAFGTTALLPTVITDRPEITYGAIDAVAQALDDAVPGCVGIHVEGPFIALSRKGAHDPALIRRMTDEDLDRLVSSAVRPMLLTVATESVTPDQITALAAAGILVSIGHSDADFEAANAAFAAGAVAVTHLFNAMSQLGHRSPGLAGAALQSPEVWCPIIADGHHVHPAMLELAIRAKAGRGRIMAISDAMPTVGVEANVFELNGRRATRRDGKLTLDDGTLAGADIAMIDAVRFLVRRLGLPLDEALQMASLYPATFLGQTALRGSLRPGARADLVWLSDDLDVQGVWIGGRSAGAT